MYRLAEKLGQYIQKSHLDCPLSQLLARNFIASSVCCSEGDIHLAIPAPQRHGFNGIIAYWGGFVNGLCKKCEKKQSRNSAFSLLCIQPVFKRYYSLTEHRLSQCYQRRVTLADTHSPSYLLRYHYPSEIVYSSYYSGSFHI